MATSRWRNHAAQDAAGYVESRDNAVLKKSLTIVLPVHNAESRLRRNVTELLEVASELTSRFGVLIIDDGSTDTTLEIAEQLATRFPQVSVERHRHRRGLGAAIEFAQRRVRSDAVILHDGVTPIDTHQVRAIWRNWSTQISGAENATGNLTNWPADFCDLDNLPAIHASMERAHARVLGFQLIMPEPGHAEDILVGSGPRKPPYDVRPPRRTEKGVGKIPTLPRPKFLTRLATFALGE